VAVTAVVARFGQRRLLGRGVGKQQGVGHFLASLAGGIDLRQMQIAPAELGQHLVDDQLFGLRFVDRRFGVDAGVNLAQSGAKAGQRIVGQRRVGRRLANAAMEKILGEQLALHGRRGVKRRAEKSVGRF
jgi:hypothetical protein